MSFLILANVPFDGAQEMVSAGSNARFQGSKFVFFDDPGRLLKATTPERMEIIRLLGEEGPMTVESISLLVAREKLAVRRDLEALLDLEIIDLDCDASYLFGFRGIRIVLQYPHSSFGGRKT
jgi:DNA-binding transcriptional ArsR family regulator